MTGQPNGTTTLDKAHRMTKCVYFIRGLETGLIKIGRTDFGPFYRARTLQAESIEPLHLIGAIPDEKNHALERRLHRRFKAGRRLSEWFDPTPELLAYIAEEATTIDVPVADLPPPVPRTPSESGSPWAAQQGIRDARSLSHHAKLVACMLLARVRQDDDGAWLTFPRIQVIADDCSFSVSSAKKGLRELIAARLVAIHRHGGCYDGRNVPNVYRLDLLAMERLKRPARRR